MGNIENAQQPSVLFSVIIVNYNTRDLLKACLNSVYMETKSTNFEIVVVDNHSMDGSQEMLEAEFQQVVKIFNRNNKRWAGGNNLGIQIAKGKIIVLLNSDTTLTKDVFTETIRFMERTPDAAIVGCKLLNPDGSSQASCKGFPTVWGLFQETFFLYKLFPHSEMFGTYNLSGFNYNSVTPVDYASGACLFIRREVFDKVGLFDESFYFYGEETDFCFRAKRAEFQTFFFPEATVIHYGGASQGNPQEHFRLLHESILRFARKHYRGIERVGIIGLKNIGVVLRVGVYFVAGILTFNYSLLKKSVYFLKILI